MPESNDVNTWRDIARGAGPPRPRQPRPVIVIGAGGIVRAAHLPAYAKAGYPVIGITDRVAERAAETAKTMRGTQALDSVASAVQFAPPDAVFDIAVPASQIMTILPQLPDRAAVLIQKPMGETLQEAKLIRDHCRAHGLVAAVNFQLRYAPNNLGANALFQAGLLGDVHDFEVQVRTYTPWQLWTFLAKAPRLEILYHSIHYLDLARSWLGEPNGIYAKTVRNPQCAELAATKTSMILDYGDWKRVFITTNHGHTFTESQCSLVQLEGNRGAARFDLGVNVDYPRGKPDTLFYAQRIDDSRWQQLPVSGNWFPDAFMGSMGALQAFVEGSQSTLPIDFESAYKTMQLVEAAYQSSDHGCTVTQDLRT